MAGLSGSGGTSANIPGTNVPPVSFPGIVSGIDYNSIIQKLTSLTLASSSQTQNEITTINAKNAELIKINSLLSSVQSALSALANPATFASFDGVSSDSSIVTATPGATGTAAPGSYQILQTFLATATSITGASSASTGFSSIATLPGGQNSFTAPLASSFAAITPTNGSNGQRGQVTIDGVSISYNVTTDSLQSILTHIQASVSAVDPGFTATYNAATDGVSFQSADGQAISLGAPSDQGNILSVLKLDSAQITNGSATPTVTSSGPISGINEASTFTSATKAGLQTPLTGGDGSFFTINGVKITINPSQDNIASVLSRINNSAAGVVASFNTATNQVVLTSKETGAQGIVLGSTATGDSSNFLAAVGLNASAGGQTVVGSQAEIKVQLPSGATQTFFSNSNTFSNAISGINLNIFQTSSTPTSITVSQNPSTAVTAINTFVSAYNAALNEINIATAPPVVSQANASLATTGKVTSSSSTVANSGPLYGDLNIDTIKNNLIDLASRISAGTSGSSFNSLASIGLTLDSSHAVLQATNSTSNDATNTAASPSQGPISVTQADGTSGALQPLNVTTFENAFATDPNAVTAIFASFVSGDANGQGIGQYLTTVTGLPTQTANGLLGTIPSVALLQNDENSNSAQISSLQDFVKQVQDEANQQGNQLRAEFVSSEALIAGLQAVQQQIGQLSGSSS